MVTVIRAVEPASENSNTIRFEGRDHGGPVSFFLIDTAPGNGSTPHTHPYAETWVVRKGIAQFEVGDETIVGHGGDIIIAPPDVPHCFLNIGKERLEMICIHPNDTIIQEPA
jgi:mannose-6-phosphate isomerase-like protein (cupin superfamily)